MPKYIAAADLHIATSRPRYRKDNYEDACCEKLEWIIALANKNNARLLVAGDIFDHTRLSWELFNRVLDIFIQAIKLPYIVHGQHDILNHATDLNCSPLRALHKAGAVHLLDGDFIQDNPTTRIWGAGFERDIPKIQKGGTNILLVHACITKELPPFYLPEALSSKEVLRKYRDFDLIISGDFHEAFQAEASDRRLLNCGPMMRKNKDQTTLQPQVFFIDTFKRVYKSCLVPVKAPEDAFDIDRIEREIETGVSIDTTELQKHFEGTEGTLAFADVVEKVRSTTEKFQYITHKEVQNLFEESECPN